MASYKFSKFCSKLLRSPGMPPRRFFFWGRISAGRDRNNGLPWRYGDNAPMAVIEFVDRDVDAKGQDSGPVQTTAEEAA